MEHLKMAQEQKSVVEKLKIGAYFAIASLIRQVKTRRGPVGKTYRGLERAASDAREVLDSLPTREELDTCYEGIGTRHRDPLLIEDYENCLRFHDSARELIPDDEELKQEVLIDIKSSASSNWEQIIHYYRTLYDPDSFKYGEIVMAKADIAEQYLQ